MIRLIIIIVAWFTLGFIAFLKVAREMKWSEYKGEAKYALHSCLYGGIVSFFIVFVSPIFEKVFKKIMDEILKNNK